MLDPQYIRAHLDEVKANCRNRNVTADLDRVVRLDDERKRLVQDAQLVQQRANEIAKSIPKADPAKKQELIAEGKSCASKSRPRKSRSSGSRRTSTPPCSPFPT